MTLTAPPASLSLLPVAFTPTHAPHTPDCQCCSQPPPLSHIRTWHAGSSRPPLLPHTHTHLVPHSPPSPPPPASPFPPHTHTAPGMRAPHRGLRLQRAVPHEGVRGSIHQLTHGKCGTQQPHLNMANVAHSKCGSEDRVGRGVSQGTLGRGGISPFQSAAHPRPVCICPRQAGRQAEAGRGRQAGSPDPGRQAGRQAEAGRQASPTRCMMLLSPDMLSYA